MKKFIIAFIAVLALFTASAYAEGTTYSFTPAAAGTYKITASGRVASIVYGETSFGGEEE